MSLVSGKNGLKKIPHTRIDSNKLSENERSKATKDGNKIQEGLNRDLLTEYDYSWATKGEG